jgi:phenylalanyl-tRNA synthetase beta chain
MLPTIIRALNINKRYSSQYGLFEIGHIVTGIKDGLAVEEQALGMGWCVPKADIETALIKAKDCIHYIFDYVFKVGARLKLATNNKGYIAPVNYYTIECDGKTVGELGVVHPVVQSKIDSSKYMIVAEINMTTINTIAPQDIKVEVVSKFPTTTLDFNFVLSQDEVYGKIESVASTIPTDLSYKVELVDIFHNISDNTKSYTIRYYVTSMDHTLTSEEIESFHKSVIDTFENNKIYLKAE